MKEKKRPEKKSFNPQVVSRLKDAIEQSLPNQNPIFVVMGCKKGWVEFSSFLVPNPETTSKEQMADIMKSLIGSLEEQHEHECGVGHEVLPVIRRIDETRQTEAELEAISLVKSATHNLD